MHGPSLNAPLPPMNRTYTDANVDIGHLYTWHLPWNEYNQIEIFLNEPSDKKHCHLWSVSMGLVSPQNISLQTIWLKNPRVAWVQHWSSDALGSFTMYGMCIRIVNMPFLHVFGRVKLWSLGNGQVIDVKYCWSFLTYPESLIGKSLFSHIVVCVWLISLWMNTIVIFRNIPCLKEPKHMRLHLSGSSHHLCI